MTRCIVFLAILYANWLFTACCIPQLKSLCHLHLTSIGHNFVSHERLVSQNITISHPKQAKYLKRIESAKLLLRKINKKAQPLLRFFYF